MQENTTEIFSINQRFFKVLDFYGHTRYKFSKDTGVSEAVLLNMFKGKNKASIDVIEALLNNYKAISADWLIIGDGNMLKNAAQDVSVAASPTENYKNGDKYVLQIEKENRRLLADNDRKQEIIEGFMNGDIIIKKDTG